MSRRTTRAPSTILFLSLASWLAAACGARDVGLYEADGDGPIGAGGIGAGGIGAGGIGAGGIGAGGIGAGGIGTAGTGTAGTPGSGGFAGGVSDAGPAIECATADDCPTRSTCTVVECTAGNTCRYTPDDSLCSDPIDECTVARCSTELGCQTEAAPPGTPCTGGVCSQGACVECITAADCQGGSECTVAACSARNTCLYLPEDDLCDDGSLCTVATCDAERGCLRERLDVPPGSPELLHENGPLATGPGPRGSELSQLQNVRLGMNVLGFGVALAGNQRIADRLVVDDEHGWYLSTLTFFAYQTGGTPRLSTFDHVNYRIWDGPPNAPGSNVIFGDTSTNRLLSTAFAQIYRVSETAPSSLERPVMHIEASAGIWLEPGTYWVDWQLGGTLDSGPWQPPITILGQATTGSALQLTGGEWAPAVDDASNARQGMPFEVSGIACGAGGG